MNICLKPLVLLFIAGLFFSCSQYRHLEYYHGESQDLILVDEVPSDGFIYSLSGGFLGHTRILVQLKNGDKSITVLKQSFFKGLFKYKVYSLERTYQKNAFVGEGCVLGLYDGDVVFTSLDDNALESFELERIQDADLEKDIEHGLLYMMTNFNNLQDTSYAEFQFHP